MTGSSQSNLEMGSSQCFCSHTLLVRPQAYCLGRGAANFWAFSML